MPKLDEFVAFLTERCHTLRMLNQGRVTSSKQMQSQPKSVQDKKGGKKVVLASTSLKCRICDEAHPTFRCKELLKLKPDDCKKRIMEKKLCINCLNIGHQVKECKASTCKKCSGRHNTLLHQDEQKNTEDAEAQITQIVTHSTMATSKINDTHKVTGSQVILSTAQVCIQDVDGKRVICRALLDAGSQSNIMTAELLQKLRLSWLNEDIPISGIGQAKIETCKVARVNVKAIHSDFTWELKCLILPSITEPILQRKIEATEIIIPKKS